MSKPADNDHVLLAAYTDISNNLRHYGQLQYVQLTIYVAISAGVLALVSSSKAPPHAWVLPAGAGFVGLLCLLMSRRITQYWERRKDQAQAIEEKLGFTQYREGPGRGFSIRWAVALVYLTLVGMFAYLAFWGLVETPKPMIPPS